MYWCWHSQWKQEKFIKNENVFIYLKAAGVNLSFQNHLENMSCGSPTKSPENLRVILLYLLPTIKTNSDALVVCCEFTEQRTRKSSLLSWLGLRDWKQITLSLSLRSVLGWLLKFISTIKCYICICIYTRWVGEGLKNTNQVSSLFIFHRPKQGRDKKSVNTTSVEWQATWNHLASEKD